MRSTSHFPDPLVAYKIVESQDSLEALWSQSNVFIGHYSNQGGSQLVAAKKTIFMTGSLAHTEKLSTFALDASDGALLWRLSSPVSSLFATSSALYVGSFEEIRAHKLRTGEIIWSSGRLPRITRNVSYLLVVDNLVYARSGTAHLLRADTGEVIVNFTEGPIEATLKKRNIEAVPEYFDDKVDVTLAETVKFVQRDSRRAVDRQTGQTLWQLPFGIISNVAATKSTFYVLTPYLGTPGLKLLGLDARSGEVVTLVRFEASPLPNRTGEREFSGGHYVAADAEAGLVYAYLGDSAQLFAFKIVGYNPNE